MFQEASLVCVRVMTKFLNLPVYVQDFFQHYNDACSKISINLSFLMTFNVLKTNFIFFLYAIEFYINLNAQISIIYQLKHTTDIASIYHCWLNDILSEAFIYDLTTTIYNRECIGQCKFTLCMLLTTAYKHFSHNLLLKFTLSFEV